MMQPTNVPVSRDLYMTVGDWSGSWRENRPKDGIMIARTCKILIFDGTFNDGASVPRLLRPIVRPDGPIRASALSHDVIFESRGFPNSTYAYFEDDVPVERIFTLKEANNLFGLFMRASNVEPFDRIASRAAVAIGSKFLWDRYPDALNSKIQDHLLAAAEPLPVLYQPHLDKGYVS